MNQKDIAEVVMALRDTYGKLIDEKCSGNTILEVIEDIEHIIDFLETNIED